MFVIKGVSVVGLIGRIEFLVNAVGLGELSSGHDNSWGFFDTCLYLVLFVCNVMCCCFRILVSEGRWRFL